jgi:hypothetical protein
MNFKPLDDLLLKLFQSQARRFRQQLLHELGCQIFVHDRMAPCLLPVVAIVFDLVIPLHIVHHGLGAGFVYFRELVYMADSSVSSFNSTAISIAAITSGLKWGAMADL